MVQILTSLGKTTEVALAVFAIVRKVHSNINTGIPITISTRSLDICRNLHTRMMQLIL